MPDGTAVAKPPRKRQLAATPEGWQANDAVLRYGEVATEHIGAPGAQTVRLKIGDGFTKFSDLPYTEANPIAVPWDKITGKPETFPPSPHSHPQSDIVNLVGDLAKINTELAKKAPLASPAFTGNPTAPTQLVTDKSTRLATTEFVHGVTTGHSTGAFPIGSVPYSSTGAKLKGDLAEISYNEATNILTAGNFRALALATGFAAYNWERPSNVADQKKWQFAIINNGLRLLRYTDAGVAVGSPNFIDILADYTMKLNTPLPTAVGREVVTAEWVIAKGYASGTHNHDADYLKLIGGTLTGPLILSAAAGAALLSFRTLANPVDQKTWKIGHVGGNVLRFLRYTDADAATGSFFINFNPDYTIDAVAPLNTAIGREVVTASWVLAKGYQTVAGGSAAYAPLVHNHDADYLKLVGGTLSGTTVIGSAIRNFTTTISGGHMTSADVRFDDNSQAIPFKLNNFGLSGINQGIAQAFGFGLAGAFVANAAYIAVIATDTWAAAANRSSRMDLFVLQANNPTVGLSLTQALATFSGAVTAGVATNPAAVANELATASWVIAKGYQPVVEDNTFTPTLAFATPGTSSFAYTAQIGHYQKIGNWVSYFFAINFTPTIGTGTGQLRIALPFPSAQEYSGSISTATAPFIWPAGALTVGVRCVGNQSYAAVYSLKSASATVDFTNANLTDAAAHVLRGTLRYKVV